MSKTASRIIRALMLIVVIVPIIPMVMWSFTDMWSFGQVIPEFSLSAWERTFAGSSRVPGAMVNSLFLCAVVVPLSLILSFYAAKNLGTRRFRGRRAIQLLLLIPSFMPQIALVFGMQKVFAKIGLYNNVPGVIVALLVIFVPYMTLLLSAVFENYEMDYEHQARTLGVSRWQVLWYVTLPQVRSGVIVTCIFSFIGVWSAYLVVAAVAPPAFKTMAVVMFPMITTAAGGYATTACAAILYIAPILAVLVVFSRLLVNDKKHLDTGV